MAKTRSKSQRRETTSSGPASRASLLGGFQHHQEVAVDSLSRLLGEAGASLLTWLVIGIALALPLCLLLLLQNLQQLGSSLDEAARISLFMETTTSEAELELAGRELLAREEVADLEIISRDQALREFQALSGFGEALQGLEENPLPPVIVLRPRPADSGRLEALLTELRARPGVELAQLDLQWLARLQGIIDLAGRLTLWLGLLLCLGVVLVIGNTIRLTISNRRAEIVVVKLVGGTDAYVARPFLYAGLWYGVGGGLVAWLLVQLSLWGLQGPVARLAGLYDSGFRLSGPDLSGMLLIVLGSGLLGWLGAWLSVRRHLRLIEPK